MKLKHLPLIALILFLVVGGALLTGCGDDDEGTAVVVPPVFVTSYDEIFGWACGSGESCQDVFNIEFAAGTVANFSAGEVTGGSVLQFALYAPGKALGDTNSFTNSRAEFRCGFEEGFLENTAGQEMLGFVIEEAGVYRLAIT